MTHSCVTQVIHVYTRPHVCAHVLMCVHTSSCVCTRPHACARAHVQDAWVRCVSFICVIWLIQICNITHSDARHYFMRDMSFTPLCTCWRRECNCDLVDICDIPPSFMWHDSPICVICVMCVMCVMCYYSYVWHDSFIRVTWLIHTCDMNHSNVWHDSFICVTWLIHICDMTHSYVWHDSFICVTWLIHMRDMTHSYVWHDKIKRTTWSFICVPWLLNTWDMTRLIHAIERAPTSKILLEQIVKKKRCIHSHSQFIRRLTFEKLYPVESLEKNYLRDSGFFFGWNLRR